MGHATGCRDALAVNALQWTYWLYLGQYVGFYCSDVSGAFDRVQNTRFLENVPGLSTITVFMAVNVAFDGSGSVEDGSNIDLAISIAGEDGEWTALGKVIRCEALPVEEQHELVSGATTAYSLAVSFVSLPDDCREALEELTLRLLDV